MWLPALAGRGTFAHQSGEDTLASRSQTSTRSRLQLAESWLHYTRAISCAPVLCPRSIYCTHNGSRHSNDDLFFSSYLCTILNKYSETTTTLTTSRVSDFWDLLAEIIFFGTWFFRREISSYYKKRRDTTHGRSVFWAIKLCFWHSFGTLSKNYCSSSNKSYTNLQQYFQKYRVPKGPVGIFSDYFPADCANESSALYTLLYFARTCF